MTIGFRWFILSVCISFFLGWGLAAWHLNSETDASLEPVQQVIRSADSLVISLKVRNAHLDHRVRELSAQLTELDRLISTSSLRHDARFRIYQSRRDSLLTEIRRAKNGEQP